MADILIRGMDMPHDCPQCEFAAIGYVSPMSSDCTLYCRAVDKFKDCATAVLKDKPYEVINHYNDRPDWCPLLPLPAGHGRLIDADKLDYTMLYKENWMRGTGIEASAVWKSDIDAAPTIVPAEGGGKDG